MLRWFVDDAGLSQALSGVEIKETQVERIPSNIPSCAMDDRVDINLIKTFFDRDAWLPETDVMRQRQLLPWYYFVCNHDLSSIPSIGCDCCLNWYHFACVGVKSKPKSKLWYCSICKSS